MEGKPYSRNTYYESQFVPGWSSLQRIPFSIIAANEVLDPSLKNLARQGSISFTKYKRPISSEGLEVIYAATQLGLNTPETVLQIRHGFTPLSTSEREAVKTNTR